MDGPQLRQRHPAPAAVNEAKIKLPAGSGSDSLSGSPEPHPAGRVRHGLSIQFLRLLAFVSWATAATIAIHASQLLGAWLYFIDRRRYYAYMSWTKQLFGILITTVTQWFSPTTVRVSGDASVAPQLRQAADGSLDLSAFPQRLVLIANHQLYTDWLYLWWAAYCARAHGAVYILLKQSLRYVPVLGPGMMFYGFVFMARSWAQDRARILHRLRQLRGTDPLWLLIFPEGTNLSGNTRKTSKRWADKQGIEDLRHQLLPRSTGLQFCVEELRGTVEWVYDCTVAYEGIP